MQESYFQRMKRTRRESRQELHRETTCDFCDAYAPCTKAWSEEYAEPAWYCRECYTRAAGVLFPVAFEVSIRLVTERR